MFLIIYLILGFVLYLVYVGFRFDWEDDYGKIITNLKSIHILDYVLAFIFGPLAWAILGIILMMALGRGINEYIEDKENAKYTKK